MTEDLSGRQFGAYRIVEPLGEGGMAAVYKAYQPAVDRYVAIKILARQFAGDPEFLGRFRHEARIVAQLQHPHVLPVFDFGESGGYTYLAMPLVHGGTLAQSLRGQPLPIDTIVRVVAEVGAALDYAHAKGIVHRDIKPTNILVDEGGHCMVADFGIARIAESSTHFTITGALIGTPAYMSPEQASGGAVQAPSDFYSLGIVMYEMLTGRVPFKAETPVAVAVQHVTAPLPPPSSLNRTITPAVEAVVLKALARAPGDRFSSGRELAAALTAAAAAPATAPTVKSQRTRVPVTAETAIVTDGRTAPGRRDVSRRMAAYATAALAIVLAIGAAALWRTARRPNTQDARAATTRETVPPPSSVPQPPTAPAANAGTTTIAGAPVDVERPKSPPAPAPVVRPNAPPAADAATPASSTKARTESRQPDDGSRPRESEARVALDQARKVLAAGASAANVGRAAPLFQRACDGGELAACASLGELYQNGAGRLTKDEARAGTLFKRACDGGHGIGCQKLGDLYASGHGVAKDEALSATLFQRSCDLGSLDGCNSLGAAYMRGRGVARDALRGAELWQRACDGGDAKSCGNLGAAYMGGSGVARDEARGAALLEKGCAGSVDACDGLAHAYDSGRGVTKDEARARSLYQRACEAGRMGSCTSFGYMLSRGLGGSQDDARAAAMFTTACDGGNAIGCNDLGIAYSAGRAVARDPARAAELFQRACDGGAASGCDNLGLAYATGRGVAKDESRSVLLFKRACDGGQASGCSNLGNAYRDGRGVAKNDAEAASLFKKACDAGVDSACTRLAAFNAPTAARTSKAPGDARDTPSPPASAPQTPIRIGGTVKTPAKVKDVRPEYPVAAQSARVEGAVVLDVTVGADGKVTDVKVTRSIPQLDAAAVTAIKQWEFAPTVVNGAAVPVVMTVTENFTLAGAPQVTPPRLMTEIHPEYTAAGRNAKIAGEVVLSGWVELDGKVSNIAVVQSLDSKYGLDDQAIKAFSQWRFTPATRDGKPVRARITARLAFSLAQ